MSPPVEDSATTTVSRRPFNIAAARSACLTRSCMIARLRQPVVARPAYSKPGSPFQGNEARVGLLLDRDVGGPDDVAPELRLRLDEIAHLLDVERAPAHEDRL